MNSGEMPAEFNEQLWQFAPLLCEGLLYLTHSGRCRLCPKKDRTHEHLSQKIKQDQLVFIVGVKWHYSDIFLILYRYSMIEVVVQISHVLPQCILGGPLVPVAFLSCDCSNNF